MSCFLWLLFPFMDFSVNGKKQFQKNSYKFSVKISIALLQSRYFSFSRSFQIILFLTTFAQIPSLNQYEKAKSENCGAQTTKLNLARHRKRCSVGSLYCTQCPNFSTTSQVDSNYHVVKIHATPRVKSIHKCKICFREFPGFYAMRQHQTIEHGIQLRSAEFDVNNLFKDDDADLKEKLQEGEHFLVEFELEKGRHRVFNFTMSTSENYLINKKLDLVFKGLNCAAKVILAFGFVLKNVEDRSCS